MTSTRTLSRSFAAGEIAPEMFGRLDLTQFQTGLALCENMTTLPHGPAQNRAGFQYVNEAKISAKRTRLIRFQFSTTQTMVLEFGDGYIRFHTDGATVLSGMVPYEIATPYLEADLFDLHYTQSNDVMTIVHPNYAPRELRRLAALNWTLTTIAFAPIQPGFGAGVTGGVFDPNFPGFLPPPAYLKITNFTAGATTVAYGVIAVGENNRPYSGFRTYSQTNTDTTQVITLEWGAVGGAVGYRVFRSVDGTGNGGTFQLIGETTALTMDDLQIASNNQIRDNLNVSNPPHLVEEEYVLTAVSASGEESLPSSVVTILNDIVTFPTNTNYLEPTALITFDHFNVYKKRQGLFGYIGQSQGYDTFYDNNIEPDLGIQPPNSTNPFALSNNYPGATTYYDQRRVFAGTNNLPQNFWATKIGTESSMSSNLPPLASDAISFRIAAREVNTIRHTVPLTDIIMLTNSAEWRVFATDGGTITPATTGAKPISYVGANNVQPAVTSSSMFYAQARGGHIREIRYSLNNEGSAGYTNADASIMAWHLFNYKTVVDLAFSQAPIPTLWAVSSDGKLLGLTYVPEQQVAGWHRHTTDGTFESCCVVAEGDEDMLYVVVRRLVNGTYRRYVERMHTRSFTALEDGFFVDCGLTYTGAAATTISGLAHLEGKTVNILGNGAVMAPQVVTGGQVVLEQAVTKAHIGLPLTCQLRTLPMTIEQLSAFGQGRVKNVNKTFLRVYKSSIVKAGPSITQLREYGQRTNEPYDSPPALIGNEEGVDIEIPLTPAWTGAGQIVVSHSEPLPLTVLSMALDVAIGG